MTVNDTNLVLIDNEFKELISTDKGYYIKEYIDNKLVLTSIPEIQGFNLISETHNKLTNQQRRR